MSSKINRRNAATNIALAFFGAAVRTNSAHAQAYPNKPIRWIVPYSPGGGNDTFARLVGQKLSENIGQPVVIDNRPGAAGLIGGTAVAKAAADGYTIMIDQSSIATNGLVYKKMAFDAFKDLAPLMLGAKGDNTLLVSAASPVKTVADLISMAKEKPGRVAYATGGVGSSQHLAMELFRSQAGISLLHVPYKSTPAAIIAVSVDEVQVFLISVATALGYIKSGKVRAIAVTGAKRSHSMPDIPTLIESGLENYTSYNWVGVFTTSGTPQPVIDRLNTELVEALYDPGVKDTLTKQSWVNAGGPPESLRRVMDEERVRYERVIKEGGIQIEQP